HQRTDAATGYSPDHLLDLGGEHLQAAAVRHAADPALDPDEAVSVDAAGVAGPEPTVGCQPVAEISTVRVAGGHGRRTDAQLPDDIVDDVRARLVEDPYFHTLVRTADRAEFGVAERAPVGRVPPDDFAADLGLAVAIEHRDAEPLDEAARLERRQGRGDASYKPQ